MIYIFDEIDKLTDDFPERNIHLLSPQRREKAYSYRFPLDRKLSVAAYLLLRLAIKENYGIDEPVVFSYGKNGKPYLRDYPAIYFNLSHCKSAIACAVSNSEIGVDVQELIPVSDNLARRVLSAKEFELFKTDKDPPRRFCEYWVMKESFLKKTGNGIGTDLTALSSEDIKEKTLIQSGYDYCCCVAGAHENHAPYSIKVSSEAFVAIGVLIDKADEIAGGERSHY